MLCGKRFLCIDMPHDKSAIGPVILSLDIFLYMFFTRIWSYKNFTPVLGSIRQKTLSQNNRMFIRENAFKSHSKAVL